MTYEEYKRKYHQKEPTEDQDDTAKGGYYDRYKEKYGGSTGNTFGTNAQTLLGSFSKDFDRFSVSAQESSKTMGYGTAKSAWDTHGPTAEKLQSRVSDLKLYFSANKDLMDEAEYNRVWEYLENAGNYLTRTSNYFNNNMQHYSGYESEEDYNLAVQKWQKYWDKWWHYTEAVDFGDIAAYRNYNNPTAEDLSYYDAATDNRYFADGKDQYGNDLILVPLKEGEGGLMGHKGRSRYASPVEFDGKYKVRDPLGLYLGTDVDERESAPTDAATGKRDEILSKGTNDHWEQMTEDEINMYYYLLGARGLDTAMEYLDDTTEKRNAKWGALEAQRIQNIDNGLTKFVSYGLFSLEAGLDQWGSGVQQALTREEVPTSGTQHANQELINDLDGFAKIAYQAGNTVGNMLPSIIISKGMGELAGAASVGMSAGGNAYGQALKEGYSVEQARTYGVLIGASEASLQYLIGGIGDLGGISSKALLAKASMIDTAFFRLAAKYSINIGSEMLEEELQLFLEPAIKSIVFGEVYELPKAEAILETALVTFLSTGALDGGGTIATDMAESKQLIDTGRTIMGSETGVPALLDLASEMSGASAEDIQKSLTKQANKVSERMEAGNKSNNTARKVAKLYDTVQTAKTSQNQADIVKSLTRERNGFSQKDATAIAEALVAQSNGQELSPKQERLLNSYKDDVRVQNAKKTIVSNEKSTMGQRNQKVAQLGQNIAFEAAVKEVINQQYTEKEFTPEGKFDVATDADITAGKALDKDGNAIDIKGVASIHIDENTKKPVMLLDIGDGKTINAKDVSYSDKNADLIYEAIANLGDRINAETANKLIKQYDGKNAQVFSRGIAQAYTYGFYGISKSELNGKLASELTTAQINAAYELGKQYRPVKDMADKANAKVKKAPGEKGVYYRDKDGNATDIRSWLKENEAGLKDIQKTGIEMMEKMSEMLGVRFNVFESWVENGETYYLDENGEKQVGDPNGFYDRNTGEIYIDLHAGVEKRGGEIIHPGTIIFTVAHEMTHFMRQFSPAEFTKIAKIVFQHGGMKGSITELVAMKQAKAKAKGKYLSYDAALEEVVADGMETILKDGKVVEFMADVKKQDQRLWAKLKEWFQNLAEFLKEMVTAYSSHSAQSTEGARVAEFSQKLLNQIEQIWAKGALDAGDTYRMAQEQFSTANMQGNADGAVVHNEATEALTDDSMFHMRTEFEAMPKQVMSLSSGEGKILSIIEGLDAKEVNGLTNKSINGYTGRAVRAFAMKNSGFTQAQIQRVNAFMDNMADFMKQAGVTYKFIGLEDVEKAQLHYTYNADGSIKSIVLSAMVKNGDYPVNFDLSSICKKREAMSALINKLAKRGSLDNGTVKLTPANIFAINTALKNEGYETACLGCFVESKRYNSMEWAKTFCNKWNAAVKKANPNATYFGYGDATFNEDSFTLEQAVKVDEAATKYIKATKTERLANALKKYQAKEQAGQPLVESFSKAAKERLVKSDTISEELKTKYLTCDPKSLNMADVEFLLENGVLPGASLSNKQAITEMVKSGEAYQHLLRPSDLLTDRGISKLEALPNFHGVLYGHYGSGTPKLMQSYTPYNSEIALLPTNKNKDQSLAEYLYSIAGVRMQSFSDFQIQNLYDYLQMVGDLAAQKLPAHAYTKEISFAKLLGMTGIKTNLSVMFDIDPMVDKAHAGLTKLNKLVHRGEYAKVVLEDAQGKWVYNIGDYQTQRMFAEAFPDEAKRFLQSIGFADAVKLQSTPGYSANCGIIGVGYSDLGIFAMLDDNRIRYIIPYHASSLPAEIKVATHIEIGTDYTSYQNNMKIDSIVDRNGNKVEWSVKEAYKRLGNGQAVINELNENIRKNGWVVKTKKAQTGHGSYGLYEDLQQTNDPRQTASNFMDWCAKNGTLPLFYQFASHENYYKLIYDYNVYDCVTEEYAPQQAVTNTYPTMVDGQVQPGTVTDGGFNTEYLQQTAEKQMAFMNKYNENRDAFLEELADDIDDGTMFSERKTFAKGQNAKGEFTANVLVDLANSDSKWWTGRYNHAILGMSKNDDTEFRQFHQEIEKRTKDMEEYGEAGNQIVEDAFIVQDGKGNKFIYRVALDGYMHGVVVAKINLAKYKSYVKKYGRSNNHGRTPANTIRRVGNARANLGSNGSGGIGSQRPNGNSGPGGVAGTSPQSHNAGNDSRGESTDQKVSEVTTRDSNGNSMSDRAKEILASAKPKMIGKNEKANIEFDTVRELFNELNSDKDIQALADRVFNVAKEDVYGHYGYASYPGEPKSHLRLPMAFVGNREIPNGVHGQFRKNTIWGDIVFSYDYFMDEGIAPQSKASTILHEVIHAITCSHIENAYRWSQATQGMYADPLAATDFDSADERIKAGFELIDVFEQVRSAPTKDGENLYGQLTAYEMVAEMANVDFRNFLKKQKLWNRIVDAIKRIFGIPKTTAYDAVSDALERILTATTNDADAQRAKTEAKYSDRILMGSLFSGGGTLEAGLAYQMLDKQFGVEYDGRIAAVYAQNHGDHIQVGKVEDFDISKYDDIFYLHASPVCHNFSKAKHGASELAMDIASARATAKHLETAMPQVFTVENAPGYLKSQSLKIITDKLTELGYKWDVDIYNSADYGSATSRNRVILRAVKDGELPAKPTKQARNNSWDKVTRDLWDTLPKANLRPSFISAIENTRNLPILDANGKVNVNKPLLILTTTSGHTVTYCWEGDICPTLTTKCGEARLVMPDGNIYAVTPEFMGRIQGLPDDYKYPKEKTRAFTIIGNGIPTHLTKAVVGGVLDSAYEQTHDGQALYSDRDTESVSNRSLLANAFEGIITNPIEKQKIQEYKGRVAELDAEEKKLREINAQIRELSFGKGPRDTKKIKALRFDAVQTVNRITTLDKMLFRLEAATPLQNILNREKNLVRKREKQKSKEALAAQKAEFEAKQKETIDKWRENRKTAVAKARETAEKREARTKLQKLVLDTVKWISYPAKTDVKCPDILKKPYADFLNGIDLSSKRLADGGDATKNDLRLANAMDSLATALDKIMLSQDPSQDVDNVLDTGYLDLPADFVQKLRDMTENIKAMMVDGEYVVNTMTAAEVRQLSQMIRTLNHAIKTMSKLYANLRFANIEELGFDTMDFIDALGEIEKTGGLKDFVQWDNALPYYAFKRFGKGGESVFEGLMDAQDKLAFLAQDIFNFRDKAWTDKEAKAWSEDTHTINLPNGTELTLTTADAMSIYCLSRREQGLQHLLGGGTRVMGIQKGSKKAKDSRSLLTIKDIEAINSSLTDRQKAVAEAIQEFMSTVCSDWGNEISMKRFLTKEFNEKFYFPIESNDENLPTKDPAAQQSDLFRLLNISATKPLTPGANNEVIIRNIFDVFTGHASDMARLNAYGMALLDYMKWLNYREKTANEEGQITVRGVRKSMEQAFGNAANSYVLNLVKDVNGRPSDGGEPNILMKWMRAAKTASVGSSLRVATLQITSYPRAALVLSPKSLALGLTKIPNIKRAKKYCGIALWKSFGFYDTNISRSIEDQMKGVKDVKQKLIELSLKGAEWGDAITWGCLWNACEYEVAQTTKNKVGSEEFYQEVGKKLREVVYRTQVVDSTLTRSQLMRSKRGMAQEAAAFMSEPTLSANILMDAGLQFSMEKRRTGSAKTAWKNTGKYIGRAVIVYGIGQLAAALLEGLWDAWRDDEDEEFKKKYLDAFIENLALDLVPFNKIPIVSDVFEAALAMFDVGFYSSDKMSTTWLTQAVSAVDAWKSALSGESSTTVYNALYKTTRAISSFYGVSFSGVMREGVALWNNTAGVYDTTLKIRQYELPKGDLGNELYEAIISGNTRQAESLMAQFDDSNSMHSAVRKALRENDPRIKEAAQAQLNGDPSERVRIAKLIIADGFVQDDVVAAINAEISAMTPDAGGSEPKKKGFYTVEDFAMEIANGDQATAYAAKEDIIATAQANGKTAEKAEESFISSAKTALKKQFLAGNISEQETINALKTFCGIDEQDAMADVQYWAFRQEYPEIFADDQWFDAYYEKVADSGISIDVYMGYRDKVSTITGEGKKERRMAVIHSLPITIAQKDALYLAEGWAESKLFEAPWH